MSDIRFLDILKLSDQEYDNLKLMFNSDWNYEYSAKQPKYLTNIFGTKNRAIDLLEMYGSSEADIVRESVKSHNPSPRVRRFKNGNVVFAFIHYEEKDWLLVNAFTVTNDSKKLVDADELTEYRKYFGRLVVTWENRTTRNIRMTDKKAIAGLTVKKLLEKPYYETAHKFPGCMRINIPFWKLKEVLELEPWRAALKDQKAIYLITDTKTNKRYVGSATSENGLYARWLSYAKTHHGNNKLLKQLKNDYIEENFYYSVLEVFSSSTSDDYIKQRERWWKDVMLSYTKRFKDGRVFGYNDNLESEN